MSHDICAWSKNIANSTIHLELPGVLSILMSPVHHVSKIFIKILMVMKNVLLIAKAGGGAGYWV